MLMLLSDLEIGQIVRLNSGSPDLKIIATDCSVSHVAVEWLDNEGEVNRAVFPSTCLTPIRKERELSI